MKFSFFGEPEDNDRPLNESTRTDLPLFGAQPPRATQSLLLKRDLSQPLAK